MMSYLGYFQLNNNTFNDVGDDVCSIITSLSSLGWVARGLRSELRRRSALEEMIQQNCNPKIIQTRISEGNL
jgi:hypothetical protein